MATEPSDAVAETPPAPPAALVAPRVFLLDGAVLVENRRRLATDEALQAPLAKLLSDADEKLSAGPFSVTKKEQPAPSGDKHDYCSVGPYWWPDPSKPDGLPYIRKDGQKNPDRGKVGDASRFGAMQKAVVTLSYAWFFTGREDYAEHASKLLRVWFLDPAKRMNPHLTYAQGVPGHCDGRCYGIVDSENLPELVDAVGLLESAACWRASDQQGLVQWFDSFLEWLRSSKLGREEDGTKNNHATQYDVQLASYALFVDKPEIARQVLQRVPKRRIDSQIRPDGSQPQELSRENSWDYSCYNLKHFVRLARLAQHVDVDLWAYDKEGRSIKQAIAYLLPYVTDKGAWPHKQHGAIEACKLQKVLLAAPPDMGCAPMARKLLHSSAVDRLLNPLA
eukprot:Skav225781  [mRNA]  locus=scaffold1577:229769:230947:+ [translate_table: standard]